MIPSKVALLLSLLRLRNFARFKFYSDTQRRMLDFRGDVSERVGISVAALMCVQGGG